MGDGVPAYPGDGDGVSYVAEGLGVAPKFDCGLGLAKKSKD